MYVWSRTLVSLLGLDMERVISVQEIMSNLHSGHLQLQVPTNGQHNVQGWICQDG